ncbi:MAG: hypothetical protein A3I66_01310 [Burkholderiales bacterium RIFCSPLOWO2_02_FULL_57_36]|nr:MAG: hypothetical protein A3I66_01310 [Burkholderiales bacterium RIFCSPLOWO2_02_FULL_57_36]
MSVEAISWALGKPIKSSPAKFVLVVMANCADSDMVCWPSMAHIESQTSQDRKTVQENIRRLREWGFIEDTGFRKGSTKQVIVYRLKEPENGHVEEAQKRDASKDETGPNFPHKRPNFPGKEAQISHERGPKTGHGTIKEPSKEPSGNRQLSGAVKFDPSQVLIDMGVDEQTVTDWMAHRKAKKAQTSITVIKSRIAEAGKAGLSLDDALKLEISRNWQGFEASWVLPKQQVGQSRLPVTQAQRSADNEEAKRLLFGRKNSEVIDV